MNQVRNEETSDAKVVAMHPDVVDDRKVKGKSKDKTKPKGGKGKLHTKVQPKADKAAPELHECLVTGDMVPGYFRMGMNARLKSAFLKVSKGKAMLESLSPREQEIFALWNKGVSLGETAKQTAK